MLFSRRWLNSFFFSPPPPPTRQTKERIWFHKSGYALIGRITLTNWIQLLVVDKEFTMLFMLK